MNPKQKAVENVKSYLDKRVEKNNHKLLDYRDREKVYGLRYEDKKDVIHAENEFIDNLLRGDAATSNSAIYESSKLPIISWTLW